MIILFDKNETSFTSLGLGVLRDSISCRVVEELNGSFELEMEYPISGQHYSDIGLEKIILAKPNEYDDPQPFRIYEISKPINGIVVINAEHISYDMSGYTVKPFEASSLSDALSKIQNGSVLSSPFIFTTDKTVSTEMTITKPSSMRSLLAGSNGSLLDIYKGEYKFNKFTVSLLNNRGQNRGVVVKYGKNMVDLDQTTNSSKIYTGVYPYYYSVAIETKTTTEKYYQQVYIVQGSTPLSKGWFSLTENGIALIPLVTNIPVQVATQGVYYQKIYIWTGNAYQEVNSTDYPPNLSRTTSTSEETETYVDLNTSDDVYIISGSTPFSSGWLTANSGSSIPISPTNTKRYKIKTSGEYYDKIYSWDSNNSVYVEYTNKGIVYIDSQSTNHKILTLDMTSTFSEPPTIKSLEEKANEYITNNDIGEIKKSLKVSFIKLSESPEYAELKNLENVQLGDTVKIVYERLGVNSNLEVISTDFNVIKEKYNEIKLGEKETSLTDNTIEIGDTISSLENDSNYTDKSEVNELIADTITAEYIQAQNAELTEAQIEELETIKIRCTGLIEASMIDVDKLVAELLIAENAEIKGTLEAGSIKVKGEIIVTSGSISIEDSEGGTSFIVDEDGNVMANSMEITGGSITIGDNFEVTNEGVLTCSGAVIEGEISATTGEIGGFTISEDRIYSGTFGTQGSVLMSIGTTEQKSIGGSASIDGWVFSAGSKFGVTEDGDLYASNAKIEGDVTISSGYIKLGGTSSNPNFEVDSTGNITIKSGSITIGNNFEVTNEGVLTASDAIIDGTITAEAGEIGGFTIDDNSLFTGTAQNPNVFISTGYNTYSHTICGRTDDDWSFGSGSYFGVTYDGIVYANDIVIGGGSISIGGTSSNPNFEVDSTGNITIKSGSINIGNGNFEVDSSGNIVANSGSIGGFNIARDITYDYYSGGTMVDVDVDKSSFIIKVGLNFGAYQFTFQSSQWKLNGSTITISDYGIEYSGTPANGDKIYVYYNDSLVNDNDTASILLSGSSTGVEARISTGFGVGIISNYDSSIGNYIGGILSNKKISLGDDNYSGIIIETEFKIVNYGSPTYSNSARISNVGPVSLSNPRVNATTFGSKINHVSGTYKFLVIPGETYTWCLDGVGGVTISDYGITYSGTATIGNELKVVYTGSTSYNANSIINAGSIRPFIENESIFIGSYKKRQGSSSIFADKVTEMGAYIEFEDYKNSYLCYDSHIGGKWYIKDIFTGNTRELTV